jgi:hypothetical protein
MKARVDDELVIRSPHLDEHTRTGRIVEVRGPAGEPPYVVQWDDSGPGHTVLVFPGPDAQVRSTHEAVDRPDRATGTSVPAAPDLGPA